MGIEKKIKKKNLRSKSKLNVANVTVKKIIVERLDARITRSASKVSELEKTSKKNTVQTVKVEQLNAHTTRSASKITAFEKSKNPKKGDNLEKSSPRITRSFNKKLDIDVKPVAPIVAPIAAPTTKSIVKRAEFFKSSTFAVDDIVLAKQKYSSPWPARVLTIENNKVSVYFFGDRRIGWVSANEIYDLTKSLHAVKSIALSARKPRGYFVACKEVERILNIDCTNGSVFETV